MTSEIFFDLIEMLSIYGGLILLILINKEHCLRISELEKEVKKLKEGK